MEIKRVPGVPVFVNGAYYLIPSLTLQAYFDNAEAIDRFYYGGFSADPQAFLVSMMPLVLSVFSKNYPEVDSDALEDWLDLNTFREVLMIALGRSGKAEQPPEERRAEYEAVWAEQDALLAKAGFRTFQHRTTVQ